MRDAVDQKNDFDHLRVLIVDDIPTNLKVLGHLVQKQGAKVDTCLSGEEALGLISLNDYHIILVDLHMPTMSGFELGEKLIASRNGKIPLIVAQTADETTTACRRTSEIGFDGHLTKPIRPANVYELLSSVNQFAGSL